MKIAKTFRSCGGSQACPTVYRLESGDVVIQSYSLPEPSIELPKDEGVLLIPKDYIEFFITALRQNQDQKS